MEVSLNTVNLRSICNLTTHIFLAQGGQEGIVSPPNVPHASLCACHMPLVKRETGKVECHNPASQSQVIARQS